MAGIKYNYNWDGKILQELCEKTGASIPEICKKLNIDDLSMRNYISNKSKPGINILMKIANFFAVPLDLLCGRCDETTAQNILNDYSKTYEAIRLKDYEDCLFDRKNGSIQIPTGYWAPYPYNLLDDIFREPVDHVLNEDELNGLEWAINSLMEREQTAIRCYYEENMSLEQTGNLIGPVTPSRTRQIIAKAVRKLRHPSRSKRIKNGLENYQAQEDYSEKLRELDKRERIIERREQELDRLLKNYEDKVKIVSAEELINDGIDPEILGITIEEMDFSVRSFNCLKRSNTNTLGDIIRKIRLGDNINGIYHIRNLGRKSMDEIIFKCSEIIGYDVRLLYGVDDPNKECASA